jgi:uncharacterized protein (DUF4213/DUF364 family)
MTIASDYLGIVARISKSVVLPSIRSIHVASDRAKPDKSSKFGAMVLDDHSVGLTYVDLDAALHDLQTRPERRELIGCSPLEAARLYAGAAGWQRSLGMAAVNAISQYVFRHSGYAFSESAKTVDLISVEPGDHVGMVGYFPPLVEQIRVLDATLTVIELDEKWLQQGNGFEVTLDPTRLSGCNKVLCTGTILVNQTIDAVLAHTRGAEALYLIGPTVACLPDPLFTRGVTAVGGRQVMDCMRFVELWRTQQPWRQATRRYTIVSQEYPGYETLLQRL